MKATLTLHAPLAAAQRLSADYLARILLVLHCNLELARHPRHTAAALGPLRAALALLGDRVCEPATLRYVASILLRLLPVRWGRCACSSAGCAACTAPAAGSAAWLGMCVCTMLGPPSPHHPDPRRLAPALLRTTSRLTGRRRQRCASC